MLQQSASYARSRFNGLPSIEEADAEMRAHNRLGVALSVLEPIFRRHEMCETWGISLLHNHWSVEDGELPITDLSKMDTPKEYELRPRAAFPKTFHPSILAVKEGVDSLLEPLEFIADEGARHAVEQLNSKPEFVREFCEALTTHDLTSTFGLGVPRSVADIFELVEFTYEGRSSVSKEMTSAEVSGMKVIQTGWMFIDAKTAKCEKSCFAKCNVPGHTPSHSPAHKPGA